MKTPLKNRGSPLDDDNGSEEEYDEDSTRIQLQDELREVGNFDVSRILRHLSTSIAEFLQSVTRALSTRRPVLTHLNADTTWLLSIPYPPKAPNHKERAYFHILIDPWLQGSQSDVAKFFSQQWHKEESAVQTIPEVEKVIRGIENAALRGSDKEEEIEDAEAWQSPIDAVVVSHEFTDHMHKETLLEIPSTVLVLASTKAASIIQSWDHFDLVFEIPRFEGQWARSGMHQLPFWLGITRVEYAGQDLLYYHSAIMIAFAANRSMEAEGIIYTPHGVSPRDAKVLQETKPKIRTLALLHGLQDISLPARAQLNLGAHNGLKVQRLLGAKYWIGTHDEDKTGGGIVSWFLNRKSISLKDAIDKEREENGGDLKGTDLESMAGVRFEELGNGESIILE